MSLGAHGSRPFVQNVTSGVWCLVSGVVGLTRWIGSREVYGIMALTLWNNLGMILAEDPVRKRQRPHWFGMPVDVSGRVADFRVRVLSRVNGKKGRQLITLL